MRRVLTGLVVLVSLVATLLGPAQAAAAERRLLFDGMGSYPRLIRLEHAPARTGRILAAMTSQDESGKYAPVFESDDEGATFRQIGEIRDPEGAQGMCCGTLFELPQRIGKLHEGTLLWAASYGQEAGPNRRIGIKIWASRDGGRDWEFLSEAARSHNHDGVWEPEFVVDRGGTLWLHFADETEAPQFAQVLNRVGSVNGLNWGTKQRTLAVPPHLVRPGMPIVRRLPGDRFYFGYELCNYGDRFCDPYFKISPDGANFGDPGEPGTRVATADGNYFQHAQTVTLFPGGPTGTRLLMVGQIYAGAHGEPLPGNGATLLANDHFGEGPWYEVPAPVRVTQPIDHWCPNYSSTLLPVDDGRNVLQLAADLEPDGACRTYFGKGPAS
ncbi:sialidase family protein [Amycolatopsis magusensis]|uniref:sialidase family protein n=1 Tax=Amycolatopsis magusensis TaxID=882444 RepID=UPI0024A9976E|nr:sialidase family protein [Amycolatopsis magusensis]MDI5977768.1 sialidase family protein [Amycolatopsis magusensis]